MSRRKLTYLLITPVVAAVVTLTSWLSAFSGTYDPPHFPDIDEIGVAQLVVPVYPSRSAPEVVDNRRGVMVLDTLHFNHWFDGELEPLLSKVASRGYEINFFGDRLAFAFLSPQERAASLEEGLRGADSLLVISPFFEYDAREAEIVREFVEKGGKLVMAGDPTRVRRVNQLATAIGLNFEPDFLYNSVEHDANYRNVIYRDFANHQVTQGLSAVVLYTAGSITGVGEPLAWGDANTKSSRREEATVLTPMTLAKEGRVLAIGDATFIEAPNDKVLDNDQLLSNIADFLTTSQRQFELADFPAFLSNDVAVNMTRPGLLDEGTAIVSLLSSGERRAQVETFERLAADAVFLGLYADRAQVNHHLQAEQITFSDGQIVTPSAPPISEASSGLMLLDTSGDRRVVVIIASTEAQLSVMVAMLATGQYRQSLVSPTLALFEFD